MSDFAVPYFPPHSEADLWLSAREALYDRRMQNKHIRTVKFSVPTTVRGATWIRNHHYVEIEDEKGNKAKLHAGGLLRGECTSCHAVNFATRNYGAMVCPHCLSAMKWQWTVPQLAFLPESEAQLFGFDAPAVERKPLTIMQRAWLVMYAAVTGQPPKPSSAPDADKAGNMPLPPPDAAPPVPLGDDEETPAPGIEPRARG